jgi:hypothetical protein
MDAALLAPSSIGIFFSFFVTLHVMAAAVSLKCNFEPVYIGKKSQKKSLRRTRHIESLHVCMEH